MKTKYALHPGFVKSRSDSDEHFITAGQLAQLYRIHPKDYIVWDDNRPETFMGRSYGDYVHLYPRFDGKYLKR